VSGKLKPFVRILLLALAGFTLVNCASAPTNDPEALVEFKKINDPAEPTNRFIFRINEGIDAVIIKPITSLYRFVFPSPIRSGIRNFTNNLKTPIILVNDMLQGEPGRAGTTLTRFLINTTVGIGGLRDQASEWGFKSHSEDFGQTLAVWGVGEGPYIVLPLLGPTNPRDAIGRIADGFIDPITWWANNNGQEWVPITRTAISGIATRDQLWDVIEDLEKSSIDFYAAIRNLYRQRRNQDISNGGNAKNNKTPNFSGDFRLASPEGYQQKSEALLK
jgi:phospholipid-binding lipoprotein MlaA